MTGVLPVPTDELVAVEFLTRIVGDIVGTTLPGDVTKWLKTGFVQVGGVGGSPHIDYALMRPVISVDTWAAAANSTRPPWGKANALAMAIVTATYDPANVELTLALQRELGSVRVKTVYPLSQPRRVPDDPAGYARYTFDLQMSWTRL